jgi:hypothetical protein
MKFARRVFVAAGVWGIVILTPLYFLFDAIGRLYPSPINYPQGYYGFLAITLAWQFAFLVIGSNPARYRLMMIPSMVEKFSYVLTMGVLYIQGRIGVTDVLVISPDLVWGVLFARAFVKMSAVAGLQEWAQNRTDPLLG